MNIMTEREKKPSNKEANTKISTRDFVVDSLLTVLKVNRQKSEERIKELMWKIKKWDINRQINRPLIIIQLMERMKWKDEEIKKLKKEIHDLKKEKEEINQSVMELVNINLWVLDEVHDFKSKISKK